MSKPPFSRDEQLDFMLNAKERSNARIERWKKDDVIRKVLSQRPVKSIETDVVSTQTEKYSVAC
ncbi:hypothetical protein H4S14_003591 [Agrobacterium vitis]|nr:hypothetical protein [Agrobacterium vitis]MBE1439826.1 hypothetical protein [Agrobacterium vitis]